jgi:hypothetical protein
MKRKGRGGIDFAQFGILPEGKKNNITIGLMKKNWYINIRF